MYSLIVSKARCRCSRSSRDARDHVALVDQLSGVGIRHQAGIRFLVLQIEHPGERVRGTTKRRMFRCILNPFVADPDLPPVFLQSRQEFFTRSCRHV